MAAQAQPSPPVTRRRFLKKGLAGGVLLFLAGSGLLASRRSKTGPLPQDGLRVLNPVEYSVLQAIAGRILPDHPGFPTVDQVGVALNADRVLVRADLGVQKEVKQLLQLFENALTGFLFGFRTRPFTQLTPSEQDEVLREWQSSWLTLRRTGYQALRTLVVASYYGSPLSWSALDYPGPPAGFHQPDAPVWVGGGTPRPDDNGVFHD